MGSRGSPYTPGGVQGQSPGGGPGEAPGFYGIRYVLKSSFNGNSIFCRHRSNSGRGTDKGGRGWKGGLVRGF